MSLTATQRAILRDMAGGAMLECDVIDGWSLHGEPLDFTTDIQPIRACLVSRVETRGTTYFGLTPAGAEAAAREGAE